MNAVSGIGPVRIFVAMKKLLIWQQSLSCLIMLIDVLERSNFVARFLSSYGTYLPVTKSISVLTPKLFKFYHFVPRTSFSNVDWNKGHWIQTFVLK